MHESNFIINDKNHEIYVIDLDSCKIKNNQPTPSKYLTSKSLVNAVKGKYQFADPDCPTYGHVIADENSDLFCYSMMVLNYLYGENITKLNLEEFYNYTDYLRNLGYADGLINCFNKIVTNKDNENLAPYLDCLTNEQVYRSREKVYQCVNKKI